MKKIKQEFHKYELEYYRNGSLDFPCEFCGSNPYYNFHIKHDGILVVVCQDCLDKVKEEKDDIE